MDFFSVHNFVDAGHPNLRGGRQKFFLPFCYEWEPQHCSYCTVECSTSHHWNLRLLAMERSCTDFLRPWLEHLEKDGNFVAENAVVQPLTCLPISLSVTRHPRFEWRCTSWPVSGVCWLFSLVPQKWRQIPVIGSITNCGDWWCRPDKHGITTRSSLPKRNAAPKIRVLGRGGKILILPGPSYSKLQLPWQWSASSKFVVYDGLWQDPPGQALSVVSDVWSLMLGKWQAILEELELCTSVTFFSPIT